MRVAAFDCGTNSLRLLVAEVAPDGLREVDRQMRIVRLGEGVDATGRFTPAALDRTFTALAELAGYARANRAERIRLVATSATRDAANRAEFAAGVREILGVPPEVLSGRQEAALSFAGATRELCPERVPGPYLVIDIGGGSTEFVLGDEAVHSAISVDIGCVRLTERWLAGDPPTPEQVAGAVADIRAALVAVRQQVAVARARTVVGLAGSVTTIAALALRLASYDARRIHHARLSAAQVAAVCGQLIAASRAERAGLAVLHPGRRDVIGAGALVLDTICRELSVPEVLVSEHDILDGVAYALAAAR